MSLAFSGPRLLLLGLFYRRRPAVTSKYVWGALEGFRREDERAHGREIDQLRHRRTPAGPPPSIKTSLTHCAAHSISVAINMSCVLQLHLSRLDLSHTDQPYTIAIQINIRFHLCMIYRLLLPKSRI